MAFLNKEQYEYRREAAAERNKKQQLKAIDNGMTSEQAELIAELCSLRHTFHCSMESIAKGGGRDIFKRFISLEERLEKSGLPELRVTSVLEDIDDIDGLIYYYGEDVPEDHDSEEFRDWYDEEYTRIYSELSEINDSIEEYLREIDRIYDTSFCPTGRLRLY